MKRKIIGVTVGSPLPKPNMMQTDPQKGDYVKGKEQFLRGFVKTVNGEEPDENGNVVVDVSGGEATDFPESSGGGEKPWRLINTVTFPSDEASATGTWHITEDADGNPFELDEVLLEFNATLYATAKSQNYIRCNQTQYIQWAMYGFFDTNDKNNRGRIIHIRKMTPYHFDCVGYSSASTTHTMPAYRASGEKIMAVGIHGGQTLVDGTVKMWGR